MVADKKIILKSFYGENEAVLLVEFGEMLNKWTNNDEQKYLCAHNGKEFDFPYLCRRLIINKLSIPIILNARVKNHGKFVILIHWNCGNLAILKVLLH